MMQTPSTPQEKFWDYQRDGLKKLRKQLLHQNGKKSNSKGNAKSKPNHPQSQNGPRRASYPSTAGPTNRSPEGNPNYQGPSDKVSYSGVPSRSSNTSKDKVLIGHPNGFRGKSTPPVTEPKVVTPPPRKISQPTPAPTPTPRRDTPPAQLPKMKPKARTQRSHRCDERFSRSRYNVVPPVRPRRAFYQPKDNDDDSWGETESDDSEEDDYFGYPGYGYPPYYAMPQPVFAPMFCPPFHRPRRKKKVVFQEPAKPYMMDQSTYTIDHRATQWEDVNEGLMMDMGVDPIYIQTVDRGQGTFDVREGTNISRKSRGSRIKTFDSDSEDSRERERRRERRRDRRRDRRRQEEEDEARWRQIDYEERERRNRELREQALRDQLARELEMNKRRHAEGIDFVADAATTSDSDLDKKSYSRHVGIDFVPDFSSSASVPDGSTHSHGSVYSRQGTLNSRKEILNRVNSRKGSANSQKSFVLRQKDSVISQKGSVTSQKGSVVSQKGSVISQKGSVISRKGSETGSYRGTIASHTFAHYSPPADYPNNDPRSTPPPGPQDRSPVDYTEISIPVPSVYGQIPFQTENSTQTLGPARVPKFYYHYTQTRPRYLQDRNALFDEQRNSVLQRYRYGGGQYAKDLSPDINLPKDLEMIKHFVDHEDFADTFTEALIADFLDEDILLDVLIETISHMNTLPASHPMFLPSKQVADDIVDTEVIWMAKEIVGELAREFADGYLESEFNKMKDPLEEFLDDLFYEAVFDGCTVAARDAINELADMYIMNSAIFDYLENLTDEISRDEADAVLYEALEEMIFEDFLNEEVIDPFIEEEADDVAREVLSEYDTKLRRKTVKEIDKLGRDKLLESLILNDILRRIAHQGKLWTETEYIEKVLNSVVADVLLHEYFDVQEKRDTTTHNRPIRKVHEKMVTDVALDVLLDELCQSLVEDLGELDQHEVGGLPDEGAPANIHTWLYGQQDPTMQPTPDASINLPGDFAPAAYDGPKDAATPPAPTPAQPTPQKDPTPRPANDEPEETPNPDFGQERKGV